MVPAVPVLSFSDAAHLLSRAGTGGTRAAVQALVGQERAVAVQLALATPAAEPASDTPGRLAQPEVDNEAEYQLWIDMVHTWCDRLARTGSPIVEKMTLFWHGHFVSEQRKLYDSRRLWQQNQLFRNWGLGNFHDLVQAVAINPAMLRYLDNAFNTKGKPQENWARESMELFTMGVDQYTQADVVDVARAWTGHGLVDPNKFTGQTYMFRADKHDDGQKTIFGITKNWNGPEVLTEICNGSKRDTMARFIAAKVWSFLAYPNPDAGIVNSLAASFVASNLSIGELVRAVFLHDAFWSPQARNGLVRAPAEFVAVVLRGINRPASDVNPQWYMSGMGQELFSPPNVSGWRPNGYWMSTAAVSARSTFARQVMWGAFDSKRGWNFPVGLDKFKPTSGLSNEQLVAMMFEQFGVFEPTPGSTAPLVEWLAANRSKWYAAHTVFVGVLTTPDVHLA